MHGVLWCFVVYCGVLWYITALASCRPSFRPPQCVARHVRMVVLLMRTGVCVTARVLTTAETVVKVRASLHPLHLMGKLTCHALAYRAGGGGACLLPNSDL